mmetsp:Transcript_39191/g.94755  ORF Transcript_39191/g.94755 Transcript_39191/m.94755 type:complete len:82 (-) Transcript_39191:43-288(-)
MIKFMMGGCFDEQAQMLFYLQFDDLMREFGAPSLTSVVLELPSPRPVKKNATATLGRYQFATQTNLIGTHKYGAGDLYSRV